jgi:hypothetical protein
LELAGFPITSWEWEFTAIEIMNPPICPNGTRPRLARFEDTGENDRAYLKGMCNGEKITFKDGLVDINDDDIGKYISVRDMALTLGGTANAKGIMWYCDGLALSSSRDATKDIEMPNAMVSHNLCQASGWHRPAESKTPRPTTWMEIPPELCVDLTGYQELCLLRTPECADGSEPLMATWRSLGCRGMPDQVAGVSAELGMQCKSFHGSNGDASYAFWCDNDGSRRLHRPQGDKRAVYSKDTCKPKDGMWSPERHAGLPPTVDRIEPDKCIDYFFRDTEWVIHGNAVCPNGMPAKMALWSGKSGCRGDPDSVEKVNTGDLGRCIEACGAGKGWTHKCSRAFWCNWLPKSKGGRKNPW